jgi:hypothetical protein
MSVGLANTKNLKWFALPSPPPEIIQSAGVSYRLTRVFKHDFFAATCLYEASQPAGPVGQNFPKIVVKFTRRQRFLIFPLAWLGRLTCRHEQDIYAHLVGLEGVPRWAGLLDKYSYAIEYIDALPLDHFPKPPAGFFEQLRKLMDAIHSRGIAYCDANKRSNILIDHAGRCYLVDYQISFRRRDDLPWPIGGILATAVRYVQRSDLYHIYKHKRRLCPEELTESEAKISRDRGWLHSLHRKLTDPWRLIRRRYLSRKYRKGQLSSPTASMEDHYQPEKETWRS